MTCDARCVWVLVGNRDSCMCHLGAAAGGAGRPVPHKAGGGVVQLDHVLPAVEFILHHYARLWAADGRGGLPNAGVLHV